jgi:aryl-alcohol dehydrogenase-like predicted oxidoreductase
MQRYRRFLTDENFDVVERVGAFGLERGLSPVEVALGWLLTRPAVPAVTPGATRPEQVAANVGAADWRPTAHDLAILDRILDPGAG